MVAHVVETQVNIPLVLNHMREDQFDFPFPVRNQAITAVSNQRTLASTSSMMRGICCDQQNRSCIPFTKPGKVSLVAPCTMGLFFSLEIASDRQCDLSLESMNIKQLHVTSEKRMGYLLRMVQPSFLDLCSRSTMYSSSDSGSFSRRFCLFQVQL